MPSTESVSHEDLVLCACGEREFKTRDVIDAGLWRGDLEDVWHRFLLRLEAEKRADEQDLEFEDDAVDAAAERFRYDRDLITAEETEQWLAARGLDLDQFSDYFGRQYWGNRLQDELELTATPYVDAAPDLRSLFAADVILSGDLEWLTTKLVWRLAARQAESDVTEEAIAAHGKQFLERQDLAEGEVNAWLTSLGRDADWLTEMQGMEAAYEQRCQSILLPQALKHELGSLRLPLTRFDTEVMEVESRDAAREALFCVSEDGMSMEEVASEGRYPFREVTFLLEDLPQDLQQQFMSVSPGELLDPLPNGDAFQVCRVVKKVEPDPTDEAVKQRVEQRLLDRHFGELSNKYVARRLGAVIASE
jgi:hypothetical protein